MDECPWHELHSFISNEELAEGSTVPSGAGKGLGSASSGGVSQHFGRPRVVKLPLPSLGRVLRAQMMAMHPFLIPSIAIPPNSPF